MPFIQKSYAVPGAGQEQHIRMLRELADIIGGIHLAGVAIVAGGTGYAVGDVATLSGAGSGTTISGTAARLIVTSVNAGVVDGIRLESAGAYSTAPNVTAASIATTAQTGSGTGLTVTVTTSAPYSAVPAVGGSGYAVGDIVTPTGFAGSVDPTFRVTAVTSGVVDTLSQETLGTFDFNEEPSATSATTGGTGTGLTVDVSRVGWKTQRRTDVDDETDFEFIAKGHNIAGIDPVIMIRTGTSNANPMWNMAVATEFDNSLIFSQQPGISPTAWVTPATDGGCRIPLATGGTFEVFITVTGRSLRAVFRQSPAYEPIYLGCFTPFIDDPANKYPAPLICAGTTRDDMFTIGTTFSADEHTFLTNHGSNAGVWNWRWLDGTWQVFGLGAFGTARPIELHPYSTNPATLDGIDLPIDPINGGTLSIAQMQGGPAGGIADGAYQTLPGLGGFAPLPFGVGGQTHPVIKYTLIYADNNVSQIIGELEGLLFVNGTGLSAEDRISVDDGRVGMVVPNINSTEANRQFLLVEE